MLFNKGKKEFILSLFFKFYIGILSGLIGYTLEELELEKNLFGRKIDSYSRLKDREIFVETQLTSADIKHIKQINCIIENVPSCNQTTIVWLASYFPEDMLNQVQNKILKLKKNIEFIAIQIQPNMIETLQVIDQMNELDIIQNLNILDMDDGFEVVRRFYKNVDNNLALPTRKELILSKEEKLMGDILAELERQLYYYPNIHRDKKINSKTIIIGAGKSNLTFGIGVNKDNQVFVEIRFTVNNRHLFNALLKNRHEIEDELDYQIDWDLANYKIYSHYPFHGNKNRVIKQQVRVLDKMIKTIGREIA